MQIYERDVLSADELWQIYCDLTQAEDIWKVPSFATVARACGLRRIATRSGYFSFTSAGDTTGQAPFKNELVEEIRLFMGNEPKGLSESLFEKDRRKIPRLAAEYSKLFEERLGPKRRLNENDIFEHEGHRVRVLSSSNVWVVISNLKVAAQFPDYWKTPQSLRSVTGA